MTEPTRPFADAVLAYAQAGWPCIMPVPVEKSPPPVGFTGADGRDTDAMQLAMWAGSHADSSIAVRMPDGVIGIDVDQYEKAGVQKHGATSFAAAIAAWGDLPATWASTARGGGQPSRILFYRAPAGRYATKLAGGDVEIIQRHHRYAVVWPSPHPDAGDIYRWYDPAGNVSDQPPKPLELPELPAAWIAGLAEGATDAGPAAAPIEDGRLMLDAILTDQRPPCAELASAAMQAVAELTKSDAGSRHDTAVARVHHLVQLAAHGHPGLIYQLPELAQLWDALTSGENRAEEWDRMLVTSARKAVSVVGPRPVGNDPCMFTAGLQLPPPMPADDRPGDPVDPIEPIAPVYPFHPLEVIGAHLFDPLGGLDQVLAEAVLERTYPALRYGYDAKSWIVRGREAWAQSPADLADWAVSLVADRMPRGDVDAEKGSDAFEQAARRKRFMSAGPSGAIAKKMRSLVASAGHPVSLKLADLDRESWLLWADGVAWDLHASLDGPVPAPVDPATPHLRSAAVRPDNRATPLWDAFTEAVWPDPELRSWALRVLSIAFTGYSDKALPILIGEKDRGKTQIVVLLMSVLGSYAHAADPRLLTGADNAHASIIYALMGRRLSFIDEGPRGNPAGQERLKQLTGGGDLTGNQMNTNPVTFAPTHTLVLTTNDDPQLVDPAVRGRARLIPCEGDPDAVIAARRAIGDLSGPKWRREAPGVLAAMMAHAAAWLADANTASTAAAPEAFRWRGEQIAVEQNPITNWLTEAAELYEPGTRSRELFTAFVAWCKDGNLHSSRIPTETKWGKELGRLGYPVVHRMNGNHRALRIRAGSGWTVGPAAPLGYEGLTPPNEGLMKGFTPTLHTDTAQQNPTISDPPSALMKGMEGCSPSFVHAHTHTGAHEPLTGMKGSTLHTAPNPSSVPESRRISDSLIAARNAAHETDAQSSGHGEPWTIVTTLTRTSPDDPAGEVAAVTEMLGEPKPAKRTRLTDAEKAERVAARALAKLELKATEREAKIAAAAGELIDLPAVVTRDGQVRPLELGNVRALLEAFDVLAELTVDVETTGYPIGHADYELRTVQLGNEQIAVYLDAADPTQLAVAAEVLAAAQTLHAHSATADLVPLAIAGALDLDLAWSRMHDTVINALLADPQSTGSDAEGLKQLSLEVLGDYATTKPANDARAELFKAGGWLTETKPTTPLERSGWAQSDKRSTTMIRYGASDVLDTASLSRVLPPVPPAVLERERTAQRMTARVAHQGVRIDGELVASLLPVHKAALADAGARLQAAGVANPGSDQQVAAVAVTLGAELPRTKTGRVSVAKGALEGYRRADGPLGDFVRARLDYQHHETVLGLFLEPYSALANRGDGRARPTVYTLGAATGRMSCVRPNLQQVPRQGGIRPCLTADPGYVIVSADFASVEVRVSAALTGDPSLHALIAADIDLHWTVARQAYGPDATKEDRYGTKRGVFGWMYGSGIPGVARTLGISEQEAAAIVDSLRTIAPGLAPWINGLKQAVQRGMTTFDTYSGRQIHLDPKLPHKAFNYCVQGTARELLVDTLVRWQDTKWRDRVLMPVHDEVLVFVPEDEAEEATAALVAAMETTLYGVAIRAEASAPSFAGKDAS